MNREKVEVGKLYFEEGLPGFSHLQFFRLVSEDSNSPFYILQSQEDEQIEFWMVDPFAFFQDYEFILNQQVKSLLRIEENTPVAVLNIVTVRQDGQVTVNLKAPIVINRENRMAKQVILNEEKYDIRHPLFQLQAASASE